MSAKSFLRLNVERPYGEPGVYIGDEHTALVAKLYDGQEHYAKLFALAPRLLENLKMMTDLAERYGVGEHCDGNIIEARELIAEVEGAT